MKKSLLFLFLLSSQLLTFPISSAAHKSTSAQALPKTQKPLCAPSSSCPMSGQPSELFCPPSAELCQSDKKIGVYFNAYALVWQSKEGSLEFAAKDRYYTDAIDTNRVNNIFKVITPDFGWRPGFKLELGYYLPFDNWDLKANWTHYDGEFTNNKKHVNVQLNPGTNGVVPIQFVYYLNNQSPSVPRFQHATGDLKIHFNTFDLDAGRYFWAGKKFSFRPYGGLKSGIIDQTYTIYYRDGNAILSSPTTYVENSISDFKNDSWGIGPKIGFEAKCHLKGRFQLLANGSFSILPTKFDLKKNQNDTMRIVTDSSTGYAFYNFLLKEKFYLYNPNIGLQLGFGYGDCFFQHYFLGLFLSYEMQYWWAQNQTRRFVSKENFALTTPSRGDLMLHGLSAFLKFEF